ncbi:UbiX family flavin prenyltransferase [Mycobacteroides abscessus]|uniref:Flavin prenyltransferase UbiX n=3 Tax=Mycobacteroides abscessus TaxID=36809 RepID=B1MC74_MYCA9|nr:UbiX family flavin prenyltransferase [Mycobacteroides abscessus]EUA61356.1 putative aromatic acid decarboxylase [Mycobacteroides abscessus 1948]AKP58573.1 3-octaprenyl-4-hydroxybenzoate carboxy-lyase [Mycobacteroides abscessus UC22]EIU38129.1 putative aromatic acid decarboxylase [Mycobacteroides abscessus 6G-0125-R]EIU57566.1 putative aromatic acid decarboxylase [Mycobacteroides abscessus 6G-0728-S]EIU60618.1 putative aromatic acid decarboxylase [Mycobacteroides abscessus 6G-1108]
MRIVIAMTGATGAVLGVRLLENLAARPDIETHLVISRWGRATIDYETDRTPVEVEKLADAVYKPDDMYAPISSGSFTTDATIVVPCSMKTVAAIRAGYSDGLIARAADVTLKERRRLVLVPRETPLSEIHLDNMLALSRMGAHIVPPMPAFYQMPNTIDDLVNHTVMRILDAAGIENETAPRWRGLPARNERNTNKNGNPYGVQ